MTISPARKAAFDVLLRIEQEKAFSSILLPGAEAALSPKDRALCHQLVLGVLRKQMHLDLMIDHFADRRKLDVAVRVILRLGLFQLFFLDRVPSHSAVDESVKLTSAARKGSARGFVNAILRRSLRERFIAAYDDETERISIETSHPRWLLERWEKQFGRAEASGLAEANNRTPQVSFRLTGHAAADLDLSGSRPSQTVEDSFLVTDNSEKFRALAERGAIYFQDEGSQLVGRLVSVPAGGAHLDVCAAPGSKLTQVSLRLAGVGRFFAGGDLHSSRVRYLAENCRNQGAVAAVVQYDAESSLPFAERSFDSVLVDAPCTGTGTIGRNPEIRYSLEPGDINELTSKQRLILRNASNLVKSGGTLIYSTCSLEFEENESIAAQFADSQPDFVLSEPDCDQSFITGRGYVRTFPNKHGFDGFFAAVFKRL